MGTTGFGVHWCLSNESVFFALFHQVYAIGKLLDLELCKALNENTVCFWFVDVECFGGGGVLFLDWEVPEAGRIFFSCKFAGKSRTVGKSLDGFGRLWILRWSNEEWCLRSWYPSRFRWKKWFVSSGLWFSRRNSANHCQTWYTSCPTLFGHRRRWSYWSHRTTYWQRARNVQKHPSDFFISLIQDQTCSQHS